MQVTDTYEVLVVCFIVLLKLVGLEQLKGDAVCGVGACHFALEPEYVKQWCDELMMSLVVVKQFPVILSVGLTVVCNLGQDVLEDDVIGWKQHEHGVGVELLVGLGRISDITKLVELGVRLQFLVDGKRDFGVLSPTDVAANGSSVLEQ
jgi:hypothetical protein